MLMYRIRPGLLSHTRSGHPSCFKLEPLLLWRIVIELSQPEVISSYSNDVSTTTEFRSDIATQTLDQAEARGKNKMKAYANPIEQLLWAVEALKAGGFSKQQVFAVMTKIVDDAFPTPTEGSSSQAKNWDRPRHARTVPSAPNSTPEKDQKAKAVPAGPFASVSSKNPQTSKYLPRRCRVFHALYMPLSKALQILVEKGYLKPLEPRPLPSHLPTGHDATQYCAYHQPTGHSTDNCFRLRHEVQDLIDNEVILPPSSAKFVTAGLLDFEDSAIFLLKGLSGCIESVPLYRNQVIPGMFNGQTAITLNVHSECSMAKPQCEARVAKFKAALEQEAPKSDQEDQMSSRQACKAKSEAPLELGAIMSNALEEPKMDPSANQYNGRSLGFRWLQNPKTIWHGQSYTFTLERLAGPKS
ncbi:hypothetical protein HYC85_028324 [Camellia sinensis]|uniref:Uncharacterized protein n=1 Tax=Camellia sinensis TaxID=4442 RepID=A0A7J7FUV2_CAMSI|nr:hypothetical protein HYC85_028324 [Camellia sinensis]